MSTLLQPRERKHFLGFLWAEGPMHWDCSVAQGGSHRTCSREEERQTGRDKWDPAWTLPQGHVLCLLRPLGAGTVQDAAGQRGRCMPLGPWRPVSAPQVLSSSVQGTSVLWVLVMNGQVACSLGGTQEGTSHPRPGLVLQRVK